MVLTTRAVLVGDLAVTSNCPKVKDTAASGTEAFLRR